MTSVSYSIDNGDNWVTTQVDNTSQTITTPSIAQGGKVLFKGEGSALAKDGAVSSNCSKFSSTGNFNVCGNIMSMLYGDNFASQTAFPNGSSYNFRCLFGSANKLISAENLVLSATTLTFECYGEMFYGCTALTSVPTLPATNLISACYQGMFRNCSSLTTVPSNYLPATTMTYRCYQQMFLHCTSLTTAPELPATTLNAECYRAMFADCTSLTTAPELPATTLTISCYELMFSQCTSLNYIKMLATDISASRCLTNWVSNVAASGIFVKDANTTIPTGDSGIPSGWTVLSEINV